MYEVLNVFVNDFVYEFLQRVTRPRGGINEWLHWVPVSLHKKLDYVMKRIIGYQVMVNGQKVMPLFSQTTGIVLNSLSNYV